MGLGPGRLSIKINLQIVLGIIQIYIFRNKIRRIIIRQEEEKEVSSRRRHVLYFFVDLYVEFVVNIEL